ncbi:MAG: M15 family metallopeptidase, partial [Acidimicrobiia bacterium]
MTLLTLVLIAAVMANPITAMGSDTSTRWDSFSESSTCGDPYTRTPFVSEQGSLAESEPIFGPFGTYFGRSIAEVRSSLVYWAVPFSGGRTTKVHRAMLPALNQVAASLAAEASNGRVYRITWGGGFTPRTIGGTHQLSRHGLGLAIDINSAQNPYRADNRLITDMPAWFVDVWRSAGFCWGGDWKYAKDPMHFSWMGPGAKGS